MLFIGYTIAYLTDSFVVLAKKLTSFNRDYKDTDVLSIHNNDSQDTSKTEMPVFLRRQDICISSQTT